MSDTPTPRTNKHLEGLRQNPELSGCNRTLDFARELERELAEEKYQHHLTRGCADLAIKHRDFAESELAEQVLCNGKGAEREADLLGKVERLERENARLREAGHAMRYLQIEGKSCSFNAAIAMWDALCSSKTPPNENERLREAVLKFSAVAVNIIRRRAILLPPESEMFEAACGELTLILGNPTKR